MIEKEIGQQRVHFLHVTPELDGGRYAVKSIAGDTLWVEVDLLVDGFDLPTGELLYRHESEADWTRVPLSSLGNDRYGAELLAFKQGAYTYTFEAWVNHPLTWQRTITQKARDFQPVATDLQVGAGYLQAMAATAPEAERASLEQTAHWLQQPEAYHEAITFALSEQMIGWIHQYPLRKNISRYEKELPLYVDREKAAFSAWYSLFPRSTSTDPQKAGTFRTTMNRLPRLADLGFDVLHLPPVHPIGHHHRKGKNNAPVAQSSDPGVPYAIGNDSGGHLSVAPELGNLQDFKALIAEAQRLGLEVAMDLVVQCSPDHPWVQEHPQWFVQLPDGRFQYAENPPHKYQDSYALNFETDDWPALWEAFRTIVCTWAEWGIRIIRVDQPHGKPFAFWQWLIRETKQLYPDLLFLAEAFTAPKPLQYLSQLGFSQSYTYFIWRNSKAELTDYLHELTQSDQQYYLRPNFWPNTHDVNPFILQTGLEPLYLTRYFLAATLSSNYGLFGPSFEYMNHEAYPGREEYLNSEKYEIKHWDWSRENKLTLFIRMLNRIRRENSALQRTNNLTFVHLPNEALLGYLKTHANGNRILCIVNLDPHQRQSSGIQIAPHLFGKQDHQPFIVHDLLTDNRWQWQGEWNYVELDPGILPMHLFRIEDY
ncbi:alpha-1,4-glucan--maltose-1-phosphate maltosyltransferase [Siphonobacter sp. BAB-5405]|uniref:maltotransferase domain-containing protein n=1 Tax=Siphonobacter sp. BAB-5405 TaxID=1864825 RepID=UPI000C80756D|nr:maltotransferase domain-containing protein [Siphonobacter sp. BAB-5405]PMD99411.1 alpha-1,4-glucan--maltose-1-phosphate maltosyltransferase [Siphonobacter sp. BAB-5405]